MAGTRWLSDAEQDAWRSFLQASVRLLDRLDDDLQRAHGLSLSDYEVLVHLSEAKGRRLRMRDLADQALVSRSRLSHAVDRLERRGLVRREPCADDRRGLFAVLTPAGRRTLREAAPTHVEGVRRWLVDRVPDRELPALAEAMARVVDGLAEA